MTSGIHLGHQDGGVDMKQEQKGSVIDDKDGTRMPKHHRERCPPATSPVCDRTYSNEPLSHTIARIRDLSEFPGLR
jgi:hypothetical protein